MYSIARDLKTKQDISPQKGRIRRMDRMRGDADNCISGDLSQYKTGQQISSQRGRIRRMDRMRGDADNWISGDLSQ